MLLENKLLIGKTEDGTELSILPQMANRHGLITGASGSGKTITLKVMAESFSDAGVPVFLADVKGDIAGTSVKGEINDAIQKRLDKLAIKGFEAKAFPVRFWDLFGTEGHPVRATVESVGPEVLSIMLGLSEAQEGNLAIAFAIAKDENLALIDLKDLRAVLQYVSENKDKYSTKYGNITTQSIGVIQRSLLTLENQGADHFFGQPALQVSDFFATESDGRGVINILHAVTLFESPDMYAAFLLWLLTTLFSTSPEVGDLDKPKLVFFFDEAHLLFNGMPAYRLKRIVQIVKLIRSRGIGLYFISQSPTDIPDEVLAQLGNRVQHSLRAYTPSEQKAVRAAAQAFRVNPKFDTEKAIMELGTGEALISFQNEKGAPEIVERATILPPQSLMGAIDGITRNKIINSSPLCGKYDEAVDSESAAEIIQQKADTKLAEESARAEAELAEKQRVLAEKAAEKAANEQAKLAEKERIAAEKAAEKAEAVRIKAEEKRRLEAEREAKKAKEKSQKTKDRLIGNIVGSVGSTIGRKITNKIFKDIFK
ncbi:DUF853 family protein [Candidatus Saccharibacteria bacterium]|nr:DUF853 family protein [Candidatus Saccharibacteria bacterium]MBR0372693.1 DUF853 family protein [Candidatus Saccharibacteria bacterium]